MTAARAKVAAGGRIVIPADFRRELGMRAGDEVILRLQDGELRVTTIQHAIRQVQEWLRQYIPEGRSLSQELIAERRAEAPRE